MAKRKAVELNGDGATAVAEPPAPADPPKRGRGRPPRQPMLNDDPAFERIKEIEDLAQALDTARTERLSMLADEVDLQDKLVAVMKKHNVTNYKADVGMVQLDHVDKETVKIKKPKVVAADED